MESIHAWLNSEPLTIAALRGKVVLIDFWTYTCVNCVRTLPYIKQWDTSYRDQGLVIIGVHSPEFQFERELANVQRAVDGFNVKYAVALDNDFATWKNFRNRYWPAKYLIDKDGYIRYRHFGEGAYAETEEQLQELLREAGGVVALGSQIPRGEGVYADSALRDLTIELYLGHKRGSYYTYLGNPEGYKTDTPYSYQDYGLHFRNQFYLQGSWTIAEDGVEHARATPGYEDYIALKYTARTVNLVLKPLTDESLRSLITLDGAPLTAAAKGDDVVIEADGKSYLVVREPRLYNLVKDQHLASRELKIYADSPAFAAFAFTFGR
ncbi:MAG: redoxin domain-containing protein [Dehalococcoidia bacterium]|nr:redoxin domain-containing protein [Dehalococcoidia bacterium]